MRMNDFRCKKNRHAAMRLAAWGLCAGLLAGCTARRGPFVVSDPDPSNKIPAIKRAADLPDDSKKAQLIQDLDNDDPAVRFYAIRALEQIAGERFGYEYYFDEVQRSQPIQRWRKWLAESQSTTGR